jgi:hypothetical protein
MHLSLSVYLNVGDEGERNVKVRWQLQCRFPYFVNFGGDFYFFFLLF